MPRPVCSALLSLCLLSSWSATALGATAEAPPLLKVGDAAPLFGPVKLHNAAETGTPTFSLGRHVGEEAEEPAKAVLISFFATWCGPCKKELPFLVELSKKHKANGLRIVSISIDKEEEQFQAVRELVTKHGITCPVVMDRFNLLARRYLGDKTSLPSLFIVKGDGTIATVKQGYDGDASAFLSAEIERLLKQ
jgi:thiol-disulfide isomerase/thioredoxin